MTDSSSQVNSVLTRVEQVLQHEMRANVHCSKINSLIQCFKRLPTYFKIPPTVSAGDKIFKDSIEVLNDSLDRFMKIIVQCRGESVAQFILMTSTTFVFETLLSIREDSMKALANLGYQQAAQSFLPNTHELLTQDQIDLKLIGNLLFQIRQQPGLNRRKDIQEHTSLRLASLERKDIKIEFDEWPVITIPNIPGNLNLLLEHEQLNYKGKLGEGTSGVVFRGSISGSTDSVAIKVLKKRELNSIELESIKTEILAMSSLCHPNIIKLLGYTNSAPFCIVTEYQSNGSLYKFLRSRPNDLTPTDRTIIAIDVTRGMVYMHERYVIHRDMKSLNILLDESKHAHISDFGLVRLKSHEPLTGMIGTPQWMAPEICMCSTNYDNKVDVYSFGIVLWELLTSKQPYEGIALQLLPYKIVQEQVRPPIPENTSPQLAQLISACWSADPKQRPTFAHILRLLNDSAYHFPGSCADEVWARVGGRKRKNKSISKPISTTPPTTTSPRTEAGRSRTADPFVVRTFIKLHDAVRSRNLVMLEKGIQEIHGLLKVGQLDSDTFMQEFSPLLREATDQQMILLSSLLAELLVSPKVFEDFLQTDGLSILKEMMSSHEHEVNETALFIYSSHLAPENITIELMKCVLSFSSNREQKIRVMALTTLFNIVDIKFRYVCSMPSFLYHLLCFGYRQLPQNVLEQLLRLSSKILQDIQIFPESVLPQLIWLHANVVSSLTPIVVDCITLAIKFDEARANFPPGFWATAALDFELNKPIFSAFVETLPTSYLALALRDLSAKSIDALNLLVQCSKYESCAQTILSHLPINNQTSPALLFLLYQNIMPYNPAIVAAEPEFYEVCRLVLPSQIHQADVCKLIRNVGMDSTLAEKSGFITAAVEQLKRSNDADEQWSLLAVLFTISNDHYLKCFDSIDDRLWDLLKNPIYQIRMGAFLSLSNFLTFDRCKRPHDLLVAAAKFVSVNQSVVQATAKRVGDTLVPVTGHGLDSVCQAFLDNFDSNPSSISFAKLLFQRANSSQGIEIRSISALTSIVANSSL